MTRSYQLALALFVSGGLVSGCDPVETESAPEPIEYATLSVDESEVEGSAAVVMTSATCANDPDTGRFEAEFLADDGSALVIAIKNFSTDESSFECTQASDNGSGEVGNKFNNCSVALTMPNESSTNSYSMYRELPTDDALEYAGTCTVSTTYEEPRVTGTITCSGLIQTHYRGQPRNPIDPDVTATIEAASTFFCDI